MYDGHVIKSWMKVARGIVVGEPDSGLQVSQREG